MVIIPSLGLMEEFQVGKVVVNSKAFSKVHEILSHEENLGRFSEVIAFPQTNYAIDQLHSRIEKLRARNPQLRLRQEILSRDTTSKSAVCLVFALTSCIVKNFSGCE